MINSPTLISLVIPLFNEVEIIQQLLARLECIVGGNKNVNWELVMVDDGCTDGTIQEIEKHRDLFSSPIKVITFSRNFGHQRALMAGIMNAKGDAVICLDADLQDPPELIPVFLERFFHGYDVVYAVRKTRKENFYKRMAYSGFYQLFQKMADMPIPLDAGDFGLMSRRVVSLLIAMPEQDLFLRGLRGWVGFKQIGIPYDRPGRQAGETKYSFSKLLGLAASAFFGFSILPLRIATTLGIVAILFSISYTAFAFYSKIMNPHIPHGWTSIIAVSSFMGGVQLISTGILGEYIGRIYRQTQSRPLFVISDQRDL